MLGLRRQPRPLLGIDIATTAIKVVAMDFQAETPRLRGFAIEARPAEKDRGPVASADITATIRKAARAAAPQARVAATAMPAESVITRIIQLPAGLDDAALRARIRLDIEDSIKQPREEIAYDFRPIPGRPSDDEQSILLVATRRDGLQARRQQIEAGGLRCRLVDVDAHALTRTALADARLNPAADDGATALIDIGARLRLIVFNRRRILYQQDHAIDADATPDQRLRVIERAMAMHHGSPDARLPDAIALAGGGSDSPLASALSERLGLPACCVDPRPGFAIDGTVSESGLTARLPRLLTAMGLALHAGDANAHWR